MDPLTLISYNISFAEPSSVAPNRAHRAREAPHLIREECLRSRPDVIALQECPSESWGGTTFGPEYVSLGIRLASHVEGNIDLLVRRELAGHARRIALEHPALPLPAVAAAITLPNGTRIVACSVHLPHTVEGATARELMSEAIMRILSHWSSNLILIGDFNMRSNEDRVVENLAGGGWIDAWAATGEDKNVKFTWDSRTNSFHKPGPNSFQFIARFDRCYMRGNELAARRFGLIGNHPIGGRKGDYLSDHYGIVAKVGVRPSSTLANIGVKEANGIENNSMDCGMVDLTGDSDSDFVESGLPSIKKIDNNGSGGTGNNSYAINDTVVKSNLSEISIQEMRRLRLQKLSGRVMTSIVQRSSLNGPKPAQPLTSVSSSSLMAFNLIAPSSSNKATCHSKGKQPIQVVSMSEDIEPTKPSGFTAVSNERYVIYMAIREKKGSNFARGLCKCIDACHEEVKDCLQMAGTGHVSMWQGKMTSEQIQKLTFKGKFAPLKLKLKGWQHWDAGCYLKLNEESESDLRNLLDRIDGLPFGGKRPCDHLSLYRKGPQTEHPDPKREFGKIREAARSHNWGSVVGVSLRIKSFGGPYDDCRVLAECSQCSLNNAAETNDVLHSKSSQPTKLVVISNQPHQRNDRWNDGWDSDSEKNPKNEDDSNSVKSAVFRDHSSSNNSIIPLFVVSWNISEPSLSQISAAAPDPSLRAQESSNLIREECFRPHFPSQQCNEKRFLPDIIALQESPDEHWGTAVFGPAGYVSVGTHHSHCGLVDLLIRKDFASERIRFKGVNFRVSSKRNDSSVFDDIHYQELPSVAANVTLPNKTTVAIASNHLEPHASGASARTQQCQLLMEALSQKSENIILIGDFNMRQKEDRNIENLVGGRWIDAWKEGSGSSKELKLTWDSFSNRYHLNGFGFTARFDRAYARGRELTVRKFGLVGNQTVNGMEGDYLSDHFGLIVQVDVDPSSNNDVERVNMAESGDRDFAATAKSRRCNEESAINSRNESRKSSSSAFHQSTKRRTVNNDVASIQKKEKNDLSQVKCEEQYEGLGSGSDSDDSIGSEDSPLRANRKQTTSAMATTTNPISKSNEKKTTQLTTLRGSKKENHLQAKAKKRFKFESSSSEDDTEDMMRRLQEKLCKKYKKRKLAHLSNDNSSDED